MPAPKRASKKKRKRKTTIASQGKPEVTRSDSFVRFYSNYTSITLSSHDMNVTFSEIISTGKEPIKIEERATIVMTPEQVRAVYNLLGRNILIYEKVAGKLRQPQSV